MYTPKFHLRSTTIRSNTNAQRPELLPFIPGDIHIVNLHLEVSHLPPDQLDNKWMWKWPIQIMNLLLFPKECRHFYPTPLSLFANSPIVFEGKLYKSLQFFLRGFFDDLKNIFWSNGYEKCRSLGEIVFFSKLDLVEIFLDLWKTVVKIPLGIEFYYDKNKNNKFPKYLWKPYCLFKYDYKVENRII